jgi:hypothetical protein
MAEQNLLTYSQEFDNAAWTGNGVGSKPSVTANSSVAPDGTTTADSLNFTTQFQAVGQGAWVIGTTYTFSVYMKIASGTRDISLANSGGVTLATFTVTSTWTRFVYTGTSGAGTTLVALQDRNASGFVSVDAWGAQLEQRSAVTAYTVTTTQAITNYIPVLQTAASGVARFDNNPTTGESLGLLIEESRSNLATYSSDLSNAAWSKVQTTVTSDTVVAPDGTLTGDKLVESTATSAHYAISASFISVTSGTAYTISLYAKASGRNFLLVEMNSAALGAFAYFDLANGVVGTTGGSPSSTSITSVGNGWYRLTISKTATSTANSLITIYTASADNVASYAGNGFSGVFLWGIQYEAGAFATSYIPTVASQVTRAADAASMTGTNFSTWYNAGEGTMYAEAIAPNASASVGIVELSNSASASSNYITVYRQAATWRYRTSTANLNLSPQLTEGSFNKMAFGYSATSYPISFNNLAVQTNTTTGLISGVNQLLIGFDSITATSLSGTIKKLAYYPLRVTNTQLQALTS